MQTLDLAHAAAPFGAGPTAASDQRQLGVGPPPGERKRPDAPFAAIEQSVSRVTVERLDGYHLIGCGTVV
jgi:hypothetical protein